MVNSMESYAKMHVGASEAGTIARLCEVHLVNTEREA